MTRDEAVGCRPILEAAGVFGALFVLGVLLLFGTDPGSVGPVRGFLFFLGAPGTAVLQFLSPGGFALAWPIDVLVWALAAVWVARAPDRRRWWWRIAFASGLAAVLAALTVMGR